MRRYKTTYSPTPNVGADDYPVEEWTYQRSAYDGYWEHFTGEWLEEKSAGALKHPLQLNPYRMVCLLHAAFLFGEVQDSSPVLVNAVVEPWGQNSKKEQRELSQRMTDLVARVWEENGGRSVQQENGIISQVLGGCVFGGPFYDKSREARGQLPLRLDRVMPDYFYPVWAPNDYARLVETFVTFQINAAQAKRIYGVREPGASPVYYEHCTEKAYSVTIGSEPIMWDGISLDEIEMPGGFVPYTYVPHEREGYFYGVSLLDQRLGIAREINAAFADIGDIISENARSVPIVSNLKRISTRQLEDGRVFIDLGSGTPGFGEPKVWFPTNAQANEASVSWASDLLSLARTDAYTPPVVFGQDEGSQRSALTLAFRMIPLLAHIRQERTLMTDGLNQVARRILLVAAEKEIDPKITREAVLQARIWQDWAPVLPRDRENELNEIILRVNNGLMPIEVALERLGDIRDIQTAMNMIKAWMEYKAEVNAPAQGNPFGGSSTDGQLAGLRKPETPQAQITKED